MPVKTPDKGLPLSSRVDFTIPSPFAREHLYYLIQYNRQHALDVQTGKLRYHLLCVCAEIVCTQRGTDLFRLKMPCRGVHLAVNRTGNDPVLRMLHTDMQKIPLDLIAGHALVAMMDTYPRDLPLDTNVNVLMDFGGGVTGTLWASQIAIGHECDSGIYVIGTEGSLEWTATT